MAFSFGYSPWLLLFSLSIAGGLTYWTYRSTTPSLSTGWRALLGGLRFLSLALVCILLFKPVVRQIQQTERPPLLALLVDDTESLRLTLGRDTTLNTSAVQDSLRPLLKTFSDENIPGKSRIFTFDRSLHPLSSPSAESLRFDGSQTDLAGALQALPEALQGENLRSIVLASDGQYNTGHNPVRIAGRSPVPIHTVTLGDTVRRRDLRVQEVTTKEQAYLDSAVPVRATLTAEQGRGQKTTVTLEDEGSVLARSEIQLPQGRVEMPVELTFRPEEAGLRRLTVRASELTDEVTTRNNAQTVSLRVLESKRKVLLLGAAPAPDFTAIRRVYEQSADTKVVPRVSKQDGSYYGGAIPEDLSTIDVVVCAGFPSAPVPTEDIQRIADLIDDGTPALFFLSPQTQLSDWKAHFETLIPASFSPSNITLRKAQFTPADDKRQHPVLRIPDANPSLYDRLPPLQTTQTQWTPTPDAQVLATTRASSSRPLLVLRQRANLRTALFVGTGLWRWSLLPSDLEPLEPLGPGLLTNLLRWVDAPAVDKPVRVQPTRSSFDGGQPVRFDGQVYDESSQPIPDATVEVTITDSTGATYPYTMKPAGNGRYELEVGTLPQGTYEFQARARLGETQIGTDQGRFSVGRLRLEYQSTRADAVLMKQIASRSGGTAYSSRTVQGLTSDLEKASSFSPEVIQQTSEAELWRSVLFLVVILLSLAGEWTLRKRFGLT